MTFLSSAGTRVEIEGNASQMVTVTFNPPVTIGPSATVLNVDLNLANSITTGASGTPTGFNFTSSSFTFSQSAFGTQARQEDYDGEMEDVTGLASSISGSNFVLNVGQSGAQLTFATDSTTEAHRSYLLAAWEILIVVSFSANSTPARVLSQIIRELSL